ncbi:MAG: SEC-C domain-containing protein [Rhodocyclales bacterium]|nr:SEC-C domain-containing protein [Rhodocyclales bacterium]
MHLDQPVSPQSMEEYFDHVVDEGIGVILDTGSFQALHQRLRELMATITEWIADEAGEQSSDDELDRVNRAIATQAALDLWNNTPIPENHFRPHKQIKPERNAPCPCGSQRKYKQCCGTVDTPGLQLPLDEMAARVLKRLPSERLGEIAALGVPPIALGMIARAWFKERRYEDIIALLEPLFFDVSRLDERAALAADTLANAYLARNDESRRQQLVAKLKSAPDKTLRSAGFEREATMSCDSGDFPAAWAAFKQAQRLTPDNPMLARLEVLVLLAEGREAEARERVEFWTAKLARDPDYDHSNLIGLLHQMLNANPLERRLAALPESYPERRLILHVALEGISPPIWRRLEVENCLTFAELHVILQTAMGWENDHLYEFIVGDHHIGPTSEDSPAWGEPVLPDHEVEIGQVLGRRKSFRYLYDFGDSWRHRITVEERLPSTPTERPAILRAGARACPPEDCGGAWGYQNLIVALANPEDEQHSETLDWLGDYKPEAFSIMSARKKVASLFKRI